jgi:iron complex outermembrane recepter protein
MMRKLHAGIMGLLLLMLMGFLIPVEANGQQTGSVYGKILDGKSGIPLVGAEILVSPSQTGTTSNDQGSYEIKGLAAGRHFVTVSHLGYDLGESNVVLSEGESRQVDIYLTPAPNMLRMVIVKERYIREMPYMQHTLLKQDIELMAVRDIGDQLRLMPNVGGIKKGAVNIDPVVRGFKYSQITTLLDGAIHIEGGCPNRMDPASSHIALDDMEEMQVLKGPFALRYGAVFGGVVNLVPVRPMPQEFAGVKAKAIRGWESNWNGHREYASVAGGSKKIYFLLSGYQQQYGNYTGGNDMQYRSAYHKYGYKAALGIRPLPNHEILFSFSNSLSRGILFQALPMDDRTDDSRVFYVDYKTGQLNDLINSVDLKLYYTDVDHVMDNKARPFSDTVVAIAPVASEVLGARFETGLNLFGGHMYIGAEHRNISKTGSREKHMIMQNPMMGKVPLKVEMLWNDAEINHTGVFAEFKRRIDQVDLIAAVRFDINQANSDTIRLMGGTPANPVALINNPDTESSHSGLSFSAGATYHFNERFSSSIAAGRGTRFPDMLERFIVSLPVGFDRFEYMGNPQLKPEINNEVDLNLRYNHPSYGGMDFTLFYSFVQDYIMGERIPVSEQRPLTNTVFGVKKFENFETATFTGFEFAYNSPEKYPWSVSAIASYTRGVIQKTVKPILDPTQPPLQAVIDEEVLSNDPAPEIPPFEGSIMLRYKLLNNKIIPSFTGRFVAGQNHVSGAYLEEETPGFMILSASLIYVHSNYLSFAAGVNNILNTAYYEHLNRRVIGSPLNFYEPGRVFYLNAIVNL